jgi:DNA integrity scanning protein DisA with diadenylate cyclase activity
MIKAIEELKKYNARLTTVLNELETLEDGDGADYTDVITDIRWNTIMLENRRDSLQRRGRTQ